MRMIRALEERPKPMTVVVRRMRVFWSIAKLMMPPMRRNPIKESTLQCHGTEHRKNTFYPSRRIKGGVSKEAMITDGYPEHRQHKKAQQQPTIHPTEVEKERRSDRRGKGQDDNK